MERKPPAMMAFVVCVATFCSMVSLRRAGAAFGVTGGMRVASPSTSAPGATGMESPTTEGDLKAGTAGLSAGAWAGALGFVAGMGLAAACRQQSQQGQGSRTSMRYTTQQILPSLQWLKTGFKSKDLETGEIRTVCLAGCDICVGKTASGKLFALGDKAPPTGLSFSVGGEVQGETVVEPQYGNAFDINTGLPVGAWCPSPPLIGGIIGGLMGGPMAVSVFEVRQDFFSGSIEVLTDTNAKKAYEADYWKGILDAQGKDDGSYY